MTFIRSKPIIDWSDEKLKELRQEYIYTSTKKLCMKWKLSDNQIRNIARNNNWKKDTTKTLTSTETEKQCQTCKKTLSVIQYNRRNEGYEPNCRKCNRVTKTTLRTDFNPIIHRSKFV